MPVKFKKVLPQHLWYSVGFITADGSLSIDGRHINITSKDKNILILIKKSLFLTNKIGKKNSGTEKEKIYSVLQFSDVKFYKFLMDIGLETNKSLTLGKLKIPDKYFADFLRGVIDGDGNIHTWIHNGNGYRQWALRIYSGSKNFSEWLKHKTEDKFAVRGCLYSTQIKNNNPKNVIKFGKIASKVILQKCYYKDCLALPRKLDKAKMCLKSKNGFDNYNNVIR